MADSCAYASCPRTDTSPCAYVDRRGRPCGSSWCPEHATPFEGQVYCRRHAGAVRAISENSYDTIEPPDLESRALSLAEWMSTELDGPVRQILAAAQRPGDGSTVSLHPLRRVIKRNPPMRGWTRVWTLSAPTGVLNRVAVEVDDERDFEINLTVDGNVVVSAVPPWIADRGAQLEEGEADRRRAAFHDALVAALAGAVRPQ